MVVMVVLVVLVVVVMMMMVCAEALQVKKVELGQDVTLTCSRNASYWSMEIHSQLICCIAHILTASEASFSCPSFRSKFSLLRTSLTISNVSADDCRRYFCSRKSQGSLVHIDTFQLVSGVVSTPASNMSEALWTTCPAMFASLSLNIVFIATMSVIGSWLCVKNRLCVSSPVAHTPETPQYEEIPFYSSSVLPPAAPECVYYKAQLPAPH
ncbi:uncharacterized protein LOC128430971 isoform X1 [Pleuronectes platessa]|uniref:uncharacterized protein LOC128430971 isoform X1 n=1 Tax=Pleuronectes platessa TaxID=8262 RepID=UPI00232A698C|nr:uncharacterized protein LOC128430971 isoform X1 [Pleuronectes platessa]